MTRHTSSTSSSSLRRLVGSIVFLLGLVLLLGAVQFVALPRHDRDELWSDYEALPPGSVDVVCLGTSLIHANLNPAVAWESSGVRAYDLSGSEQSLLTMRPYLEQALRTQRPRVVVIDLHMLPIDELPLRENQKRSNLTMMPLGLPKLRAITAATPASEWTRYIIPLEQFHSRWNEIERKDFDPGKWDTNAENLFMGYRKVEKSIPQTPTTESHPMNDERYARNYRLLSGVIETARDADAEVLLVVGPSINVDLHDTWVERLRPDIERDFPGVRILDTPAHAGEFKVDYRRDYYDEWHLNSRGSEKYSAWMGRWLARTYGLPRERDERLDEPWREELARYRESSGR